MAWRTVSNDMDTATALSVPNKRGMDTEREPSYEEKCMVFDGSTSMPSCSLPQRNYWALAFGGGMWALQSEFYIDSTGGTGQKTIWCVAASSTVKLRVFVSPTDRYLCYEFHTSTPSTLTIPTSIVVPVDTVVKITMLIRQTNVAIFCNGQTWASSSASYSAYNTSFTSGSIQIGWSPNGDRFKGKIKYVKYWNDVQLWTIPDARELHYRDTAPHLPLHHWKSDGTDVGDCGYLYPYAPTGYTLIPSGSIDDTLDPANTTPMTIAFEAITAPASISNGCIVQLSYTAGDPLQYLVAIPAGGTTVAFQQRIAGGTLRTASISAKPFSTGAVNGRIVRCVVQFNSTLGSTVTAKCSHDLASERITSATASRTDIVNATTSGATKTILKVGYAITGGYASFNGLVRDVVIDTKAWTSDQEFRYFYNHDTNGATRVWPCRKNINSIQGDIGETGAVFYGTLNLTLTNTTTGNFPKRNAPMRPFGDHPTLSDGLIAAFEFEDDPIRTDSTRTRNSWGPAFGVASTAVSNLSSTTKKLGWRSFAFRGGANNDRVLVANLDPLIGNNLMFGKPFSVAFWYNNTTWVATAAVLFGATVATPRILVYLDTSDVNRRLFVQYVTDGSNYSVMSSTNGQAVDSFWTHWVVTYNGGSNVAYNSGTTKIYRNGNLETLLDGGAVGTVTSAYNPRWCIGGAIDAQDPIGVFDNKFTWNKELTATEVADLYNSGSGLLL